MNARELTAALRGSWHGSYGTARCPGHQDKTPSLSLSIGRDGRTLVKCHAGCTQEQVIDALRRRDLWHGDVETNLRPFTPAPNRNGEYAMRLWDECTAAKGTLVEKYLAARGIIIPIPSVLRFHPGLKHPDGGTWPAMVALVTRGTDGTPIAIHRTFLKKEATAKEALLTTALWIPFAWTHDAAVHSPMLLVTSPEPECGKSTLLGVVNLLVPRGLIIVSVSGPVLFRMIESWQPTPDGRGGPAFRDVTQTRMSRSSSPHSDPKP